MAIDETHLGGSLPIFGHDKHGMYDNRSTSKVSSSLL